MDISGPQAGHRMPFDFSSMSRLIPIEEWEKQETAPPSINDLVSRPRHTPSVPAFQGDDNQHPTEQFNEMCKKRSIQPEFVFTETASGQFSVSVTMDGNKFSTITSYFTKKKAKARLCQDILEQLGIRRAAAARPSEDSWHSSTSSPSSTTAARPSKHSRQSSTSSSSSTSSALDTLDTDSNTNWVGRLRRYTDTKRRPAPKYILKSISTRRLQMQGLAASPQAFLCTVDIPINATEFRTIGHDNEHFPSKAAAKHAAAKRAIEWIRVRRSMSRNKAVNSQDSKRARLSESTEDVHAGATNESDSRAPSPADEEIDLPLRVADLALSLGIAPPVYHEVKIDTGLIIYATFRERDVREEAALTGRHGGVCGRPNKRQAKLDCCAVVLRSLAKVAARRASQPVE